MKPVSRIASLGIMKDMPIIYRFLETRLVEGMLSMPLNANKQVQ